MLSTGRATATGSAIGAVVGLVAITPGAGFVAPLSSIAIGALAAGASFATLALLGRTRLDDTLDVFACHGVGGVVGSILTGVFASSAMNPGIPNGLVYGNPALMNPQVVSVLAAGGFAAAGTAGVLLVVKQLVGLRASDEADQVGIDLVEHRERAYLRDATGGFVAVRDVRDALAPRAG
jgi:Amt family ammonium transporter